MDGFKLVGTASSQRSFARYPATAPYRFNTKRPERRLDASRASVPPLPPDVKNAPAPTRGLTRNLAVEILHPGLHMAACPRIRLAAAAARLLRTRPVDKGLALAGGPDASVAFAAEGAVLAAARLRVVFMRRPCKMIKMLRDVQALKIRRLALALALSLCQPPSITRRAPQDCFYILTWRGRRRKRTHEAMHNEAMGDASASRPPAQELAAVRAAPSPSSLDSAGRHGRPSPRRSQPAAPERPASRAWSALPPQVEPSLARAGEAWLDLG